MTEDRSVTRPFKMKKVTGTFNLFPGDGVTCQAFVLNALGEGTITHLVISTLFEELCFIPNGSNLGTRTLTLTAANGDVLRGTHTTIAYLSETVFREDVVFTGVTGRFENATGGFVETIVITY